MPEVWRPIPAYEGMYEASSLGGVRSVDRVVYRRGRALRLKGRRIKQFLGTSGYPQAVLCRDGVPANHLAHRLIAEAYLGTREGLQVNHRNGVKTDNRPDNLEWVTPSQNIRHGHAHGLMRLAPCKGVENGRAKLSEAEVRAMRSEVGLNTIELGLKYGVAQPTASSIVRKKTWRHVT